MVTVRRVLAMALVIAGSSLVLSMGVAQAVEHGGVQHSGLGGEPGDTGVYSPNDPLFFLMG